MNSRWSIDVLGRILVGSTLALAISVPAAQASIIVSADSNIINPLIPGPNFNAGNQVFFSNVLGTGNTVGIRQEGGGSGLDSMAEQFFDSLPGVTASIIANVAGGALAGVDLLLVPLPDSALTAGELAAIGAFLGGGGTVFFTGENGCCDFLIAANAVINAALLALGSDIQIIDAVFSGGFQLAQIAADPLTSGVMSFTYGTGSHLSGGTLLFSDVEGNRLVAYEATVPEPPSLLLVGYGLVIFGAIRWRRTGGRHRD